ncbi:MAG: 23S rRNA (guanosine(2251)-2'-O)-methyltransferase RlmB [Deltaproteobacteria bacterium]|nr:23S rRNA (guanosine(2251)-2'-O)-methyltransferase RlmB [Deltaproteobacteria bacterium]MCL5277938.1 23S rRNA (guanosine(2251)-2'-O)-methyltransferase RlmB [Deltaproteobacteria bacterium]
MEHRSTDVIYGINPVIEALTARKRRALRLYISGSRNDRYEDVVRRLAGELGVPVSTATRQELFAITSTSSHQGIAGVFETYPYSDIQSMLDAASERCVRPFLIALDEVQDPHNTGAIVRTASCLGLHGVVLTKRRSAGITPSVVKASSGATEFVRIAMVSNLRSEIDALKAGGLTAVSLDMDGKDRFSDVDARAGVVLIVGSEGSGVRRPVMDVCDYVVSIPMSGHPASLNASVSAGIAMYELGRLPG